MPDIGLSLYYVISFNLHSNSVKCVVLYAFNREAQFSMVATWFFIVYKIKIDT